MGANQDKGYKEIRRIGKGGCGVVYLVKKENKLYALKKIPLLTKNEIEHYKKILNTLFQIKSEYVIKYYESYLENDCLCIIMEYGGNTDLKKYIKEQDSLIEEKTIKSIIIQICLGLNEIHKKRLIHRDLTPDNIFMDKNYKIKIGDFSVSQVLTTKKNYTESQVGKHHYFAPEIEKAEKYNYKADIYSLGCIMHELFTLNEYYDSKNKDEKIDTNIYNLKWQNLIDLTLRDNFNERPNIEEIYNFIKKEIELKENNSNNEIKCVYDKKYKLINLLHNFKNDFIQNPYKESYNEAKNNINKENIEIYVNDKKIKFNYIYESDEIGLINIKFKFKKLLTSTAFMFCRCPFLISIDLSSFNNNITNMSHMFCDCSFLESIDLKSFNTKNVVDMSCMFFCCQSLKSINLISFNTNKVTNMSHMFYNCSSLKSIDLSSFNTNNVSNMSHMFCLCSSLKSLDLSSFNTNNVSNMSHMFSLCSSLKSLDLSSFNTNNVHDLNNIFYNSDSLKLENIKINKNEKKILILNEFNH